MLLSHAKLDKAVFGARGSHCSPTRPLQPSTSSCNKPAQLGRLWHGLAKTLHKYCNILVPTQPFFCFVLCDHPDPISERAQENEALLPTVPGPQRKEHAKKFHMRPKWVEPQQRINAKGSQLAKLCKGHGTKCSEVQEPNDRADFCRWSNGKMHRAAGYGQKTTPQWQERSKND